MRLSLALAIAAGVLTPSLAEAQEATVTYFGNSCVRGGISSSNLPQIGTTFGLNYGGPAYITIIHGSMQSALPFLVLGTSNTGERGLKLPYKLPNVVTGNPFITCNLLVSMDAITPLGRQPNSTSFSDNISFKIPNDIQILGATVYAQWYTRFESKLGSLPPLVTYATSNAAKVVVGR